MGRRIDEDVLIEKVRELSINGTSEWMTAGIINLIRSVPTASSVDWRTDAPPLYEDVIVTWVDYRGDHPSYDTEVAHTDQVNGRTVFIVNNEIEHGIQCWAPLPVPCKAV